MMMLANFVLRLASLLTVSLLLLLAAARPTSALRDVAALTNWAKRHGVFLHDKLEWKDYGREDWGLALRGRVERGAVLLRVPRGLVLDSTVLRRENEEAEPGSVATVGEALGEFAAHEENFWIVLRLYRCRRAPPPHRFSPWLDAIPVSFPEFSEAEAECLPFYSQYAVQYQDKKFSAFCGAAEAAGGGDFSTSNPDDVSAFKWAFCTVNSRFWKTNPSQAAKQIDMQQTSELVPLGDMMNHRDPPNVQMVPEDLDHVSFAYMGDDADDNPPGTAVEGDGEYERDLFLSYGQPCNPHSFLAIFGFVPNAECMPRVWSHLAYPDANPYGNAGQTDMLVFHSEDGVVAEQIWDAILWELVEPPSHEAFLREREGNLAKYKHLLEEVLESHVDRQLTELASLRSKIDTAEGPNIEMIRQQNEFLTSVFTKVKNGLHR